MQSGVTVQPWTGLSVFRRIFSVLGWILVAMWLYVHAVALSRVIGLFLYLGFQD